MTGKIKCRRTLQLETLEPRLCMAASVGWDGPGQGEASLTYYIGDVPSGMDLDQAEIEGALETALDAWAKVADITFTETARAHQPDSIDFEFWSIDGSGGTLAQAYFPDDVNPEPIAGDIQFDSAEMWEIGNSLRDAAFDLVLVAVHEIGHALGLEHSDAAGSVMAESVSPNQTFDALAAADVDAILALYAPTDNDSDTGSLDPPDYSDPRSIPRNGDNVPRPRRFNFPSGRTTPLARFRRPRSGIRPDKSGGHQAWTPSGSTAHSLHGRQDPDLISDLDADSISTRLAFTFPGRLRRPCRRT